MPFYLVTQTSLIEAEDECAAAQKGIDRIRSGLQVAVSVKYDEVTVSHVIVPARIDRREDAIPDVPQLIDPFRSMAAKTKLVDTTERRLILKRMWADARTLITGRR